MRKLPLLTALAISALSLSTHSPEAQGYAPWQVESFVRVVRMADQYSLTDQERNTLW